MAILLLIVLGTLVVLTFVLWEPIADIRRLRGTPALPIAALPSAGPAKAAGRAGGSALLSPIADAPCVLWQVEVQEYRSSGKTGRWVTVLQQCSQAPITIDDGTGRVWAIPAGAKLVLADDLRAGRGLFERMPPTVEAAIERLGVPLRGWLGFRRSLRVRERRIMAGEPVFALGLAEPAAGQLRLCSTSDAPLILADRAEQELLQRLYGRVALTGGAGLAVAVLLASLLARLWP
jgi:hypothetical protein